MEMAVTLSRARYALRCSPQGVEMAVWPQGRLCVCEDLPWRQVENAASFHLLAASFQFFGLSVPRSLSLNQALEVLNLVTVTNWLL